MRSGTSPSTQISLGHTPRPKGATVPGRSPSGSPRAPCERTRAARARWTVRASAGLRRGAHTKGQAGPRGAGSARPPRTPGGAHARPRPHPAPRGSPAAGSRRRPACSARCTCPWLLLAPRGAASSRWRPGAAGPATRAGSPEPRPAARAPSAWCARSARAPPRLLCLRPAVGTPPARGAGQRSAAPRRHRARRGSGLPSWGSRPGARRLPLPGPPRGSAATREGGEGGAEERGGRGRGGAWSEVEECESCALAALGRTETAVGGLCHLGQITLPLWTIPRGPQEQSRKKSLAGCPVNRALALNLAR